MSIQLTTKPSLPLPFQLRRRFVIMQFSRGIATRVKKIPVQLLRDWKGLGVRGEVVEVAEGLMRNKLHPNDGACYVLKGQSLRIPLVRREEAQAAALAAKAARTAAKPAAAEQTVKETSKPEPSVLDFLDFPSASGAASGAASTSGPAAGASGSSSASGTSPAAEPLTKTAEKPEKFAWENEFIADLTKSRKE